MGINYKYFIIAFGAAAGVCYYINQKRKRLKTDELKERITQLNAFELRLLNSAMFESDESDEDYDFQFDDDDEDDDDDDDDSFISSPRFRYDFDVEEMPDRGPFFEYEDVDDFLFDTSDDMHYTWTRQSRPSFTIPKRQTHRQKQKKKKLKKINKKAISRTKKETFNEECPICTDTFDEKPFVTLDCKHRMHNSCAFRMARSVKHLSCPLCRQQVDLTE